MTAQQRQKQAALETKMEKEATRQRNQEQRAMEENKARHVKNMIMAQK